MFSRTKKYSLHIHPEHPLALEKAIIVEEGFSVLAGVFSFFWMAFHKMWFISFWLLMLSSGLMALRINGHLNTEAATAINIALFFFLALNAKDFYIRHLHKKGYRHVALAYAENESLAKKDLFSHYMREQHG